MKFLQSLSFVKRNFIFDTNSFVNKMARGVSKAVELINTIPMLGFINDIVEVVIAEPDPNKISAVFNKSFFLF